MKSSGAMCARLVTPSLPLQCTAITQWFSQCYDSQLVSDISTIVGGVQKIEGDQAAKATFFFAHEMLEGCDREVSPLCHSSASCRCHQQCFFLSRQRPMAKL